MPGTERDWALEHLLLTGFICRGPGKLRGSWGPGVPPFILWRRDPGPRCVSINFRPVCSSHLPAAKRAAQLRRRGRGAAARQMASFTYSWASPRASRAPASAAPGDAGLRRWLCFGEGNTRAASTHTSRGPQRTPIFIVFTATPADLTNSIYTPHTRTRTHSQLEAPAQTTESQVETTTQCFRIARKYILMPQGKPHGLRMSHSREVTFVSTCALRCGLTLRES